MYTELDEPTRSINFNRSRAHSEENDIALPEAWYQAVSGAGTDMPTHAVSPGQCNALAPIWLAGTTSIIDIIFVGLFQEEVRNYVFLTRLDEKKDLDVIKNSRTSVVWC